MKYTELFLYPFARVKVDGVDYDSGISNITGYEYDACKEGELFDNINRECVIPTVEKTYTFADWHEKTCPQGFTYSVYRSGNYEHHRCSLSTYNTYDILVVQYSDDEKVGEEYYVLTPNNSGQPDYYNFAMNTVRDIKYTSGKISADSNYTVIKDDEGHWRSARTSDMNMDTFNKVYSVTKFDLEHMTAMSYNIWGTVPLRRGTYTMDGKKVKETLYETKQKEDGGYVGLKIHELEWDEEGNKVIEYIYVIKRNDNYAASDWLDEWQSLLSEYILFGLDGTIEDCHEDTSNGSTIVCSERPSAACSGFRHKFTYGLRQRDSGDYKGEWVSLGVLDQLLYPDGRVATQGSCEIFKNNYGDWVTECGTIENYECLDTWCSYNGYVR
jgi:hypothetical protein